MTSAIDSMFSELMGMADSVQEEVDGAGEDFDVMSLLHRRSYNNVQRPAFRRNPNVPVITQPWTILRLTIIIIIRKIEIWDYFSLRIIMARFMWYRAIFSLLLLFLAFRPIITVRPKKSLKAAGQSIFLSKHPLHVDQLYGVFDTKKNGEII